MKRTNDVVGYYKSGNPIYRCTEISGATTRVRDTHERACKTMAVANMALSLCFCHNRDQGHMVLGITATEVEQMADVKWIKITTDIFDDEKILLVGACLSRILLQSFGLNFLCLAAKMNNSGVFMMNDSIAYTDEMLATIFREKKLAQ